MEKINLYFSNIVTGWQFGPFLKAYKGNLPHSKASGLNTFI
jgi:hypothetical protein